MYFLFHHPFIFSSVSIHLRFLSFEICLMHRAIIACCLAFLPWLVEADEVGMEPSAMQILEVRYHFVPVVSIESDLLQEFRDSLRKKEGVLDFDDYLDEVSFFFCAVITLDIVPLFFRYVPSTPHHAFHMRSVLSNSFRIIGF